jgi:hypothetical protein
MPLFNIELQNRLTRLALALVNQQQARVIVKPYQPAPGFWFGGGNMIESPDGVFYLVGRYRDAGDSRAGLAVGERGLELTVFASTDRGQSFEKVLSFAKCDLNVGVHEVLSIEGSALRHTSDGVELFISTEKDRIGYPPGFENYLKPGTGVWSIDRLAAGTIETLRSARRITVLQSPDPRFIHVKDPFLYERLDGDLMLLFCSHPYCWTSSNTGYVVRQRGRENYDEPVFDFFERGFTWDVAMTRGTCVLDVPQVGAFENVRATLVFYDGGECVRNHDEHQKAVQRPRGYSCEEVGGVAYFLDGDFSRIERLSVYSPLFVSPHGTGCSRYVDVLTTDEGLYATWQQSQPDGSQALVMNFVPLELVEELL